METKKETKEITVLMAGIIQAKIMDEINVLLEEIGKNRSFLAKQMNASDSFISQLFSLDKPLNMKHIALFEKVFEKRIQIKFEDAARMKENIPSENEKISLDKNVFFNNEVVQGGLAITSRDGQRKIR